ncbi:MAG TPA: hypothetical protein VJ023_17005, partial [Pyrinomonadaceae bacterium]|nr:hypothetical protein [Pyrinomonadaceae bacterium]
ADNIIVRDARVYDSRENSVKHSNLKPARTLLTSIVAESNELKPTVQSLTCCSPSRPLELLILQ